MVLPPAVVVMPGASRCAGVLVGALALASVAIVLALPIHAWVQAALIAAASAWAWVSFRHIALRRGRFAITEVRVAGNRLVAVRYGTRPLVAGHVRQATHVSALVTTIVWRPDGAWWSRAVLILPDMLPDEDFRQLRVLLRYARNGDAQAVPASQV